MRYQSRTRESREICASSPSDQFRVVTRYMGSGIKGLKKGGIRDHSLGSGITALGIGISVFSRINIHWDQQNFVGSGIKIFITFGIRDQR